MAIDYERLARHFLRPDRPRLAEARAAVAAITDHREAWATLAARELIPAAWTTRRRRFQHVVRHDQVVRRRFESEVWPPTVAMCLAMASDPGGVEAAEALVTAQHPRARQTWDHVHGAALEWVREVARDELSQREVRVERIREALGEATSPFRDLAYARTHDQREWRSHRPPFPASNPPTPGELDLWSLGYAINGPTNLGVTRPDAAPEEFMGVYLLVPEIAAG